MPNAQVAVIKLAPRSGGDNHVPKHGDPRSIRAGFDVAQTNPGNARHWQQADFLSADAALNPAVRRTIISRSRYEIANNGYGRGIINTLGIHTIGTGPRLQLQLTDAQAGRRREYRFAVWMKKIKLAKKLRLIRIAKAEAGEVFIVLTTNLRLPTKVKLDIQLYEAEQVASDSFIAFNDVYENGAPKEVDGVELDEQGNPIKYKFLKCHPGSGYFFPREFIEIPAENVIHFYYQDRVSQHRGLSEITSTLGTFSNLRRYSNSVMDAADNAAAMSVLLSTALDPDDGGELPGSAPQSADGGEQFSPMDTIQFERNGGLVLPKGFAVNQLKPEQPTTTHAQFVDTNINEMARPFQMPFNVAKGNSKDYNYASGRLDHQTYFKSITIERNDIEIEILDRLLENWEAEDRLYHPDDYRGNDGDGEGTPHQWFWDGDEHVDPLKEANAQDTRLANQSTTLASEYGRDGKDWEVELEQCYKESAKKLEYEIKLAAARKKLLSDNGLTESDLPAEKTSAAKTAPSDNKDAEPNDENA